LDLKSYFGDLRSSGLLWVAAPLVVLSVVNVLTLIPGRDNAISYISTSPAGPVLAVVIYDTPYTIAGLLGLVMIFGPVLFGTYVPQRRSLSAFFISSSLIIAVVSGLIWDEFYAPRGVFGVGSSAVAIAGQATVAVLAAFGLLKLWRQDTRKLGRMSSYWWHAFALIYVTLILTTVWFVVFLQSIFVPTQLYNWRVHEFAFVIAVGATLVYVGVNWSAMGLDGRVRVDETLLNYHFDDLNDRFVQPLPKLKVVFAGLPAGSPAEFRPDVAEILMPDSYRGEEYFGEAKRVDDALLHGMIHAALYYSRKPWKHEAPEAKEGFDVLAESVGASPEKAP
jgi:hypothetical protein